MLEHGEEAKFGAEVFGIGADCPQGFCRGAEQDCVNDRLVLQGDSGDLFRHGEDDMEVRHRQQVGFPVLQPLGAGQ